MSQKPIHDAKNIGARFRSARSLVPNLNRKSFCERYGINRYTMQSWENGLHVSKGKNVEKFIEALAREGVFCTSEWLIDGCGEPARPLKGPNGASEPAIIPALDVDTISENFLGIINELDAAHRKQGEALIKCSITDDAMSPKFLAGDMVFGLHTEDRDQLHQKYCIVEMTPDRLIVRKILVTKDGFILLPLDERIAPITLSLNIRLFRIVWHLVR